ncbi:hypothetical protein [Caldithrix abyssi]
MISMVGWAAGFFVVILVAAYFILKAKEKNRLALFRVLTHLAIEDMSQPLGRLELENVQRRYNLILDTLKKAQNVAKKPAEKVKCKKLLKDLNDWRLQQIQAIYQEKLNGLLKQYHQSEDINHKLALLFEARQLIKEGILRESPLKKIDNLIIRLYVMQARSLAEGQPEQKKYEIFEDCITKIFNSDIDDKELDESAEFRKLIDEFEILHRKFKGKRSKPE